MWKAGLVFFKERVKFKVYNRELTLDCILRAVQQKAAKTGLNLLSVRLLLNLKLIPTIFP